MRVLLFSGGLDSVMVWRRCNPDRCVYVAQPGSAYTAVEVQTIENLEAIQPGLEVEIITGAQWPDAEPDGHVPHRNLGLLTQVAACTNADTLYLGSVRGESSPDKSRRFLIAASRALSASENEPVIVKAPLRKHTKAWHLQEHLSKWPEDYGVLIHTRSCYAAQGRCGECMACFRRWVAFTLAGMTPEDHDTAPWERVSDDWRTGLRYLLGTSPGEWRGMLDNHRDALRALRMQASA